LVPVASRGEIAMGLAMVSHGDCMAGQGCHACVSQCPTQALAMDFVEYRLSVAVERCVGCGVCQHTCTSVNDRIAIRVTPARLLGERASL
jgi:ferredoxin-type protein NapG